MSRSSFAVTAIARNEGRYVAEWVTYHALRGADRIIIYDNESDDDTAAVIAKISNKLPVERVSWPILRNDFNFTQKAAYEDAAKRLKLDVDFIAFIDIDEFLGGDIDDVGAILNQIDPAVDAIAVQQVLFGSSGQEREVPGLVIERFTKSAAPNHPGHSWFKSLVRPLSFVSMETVHSVVTNGLQAYADGSTLDRPSSNVRQANRICLHPMRINHYTTKSREEWARKQARMTTALLPEEVRSFYTEEVRGFDVRNRIINEYEGFSLATYAPRVWKCLMA